MHVYWPDDMAYTVCGIQKSLAEKTNHGTLCGWINHWRVWFQWFGSTTGPLCGSKLSTTGATHVARSRDIPVRIDSKNIYMFDKFKIKFVTLHHIFQTKQFICSVINNNNFENMNFINIFTWEFLKKSLWSCSTFLFRCQPLSIWTVIMDRALRTL